MGNFCNCYIIIIIFTCISRIYHNVINRYKILYQHLFWFFGQMWPFKFYLNLMQQTISEEFINNLLDTFSVSYNICTSKVKIFLNMNNLQVTKNYNTLVGTSEAIRLLNINNRHYSKGNIKSQPKFIEWLAGL